MIAMENKRSRFNSAMGLAEPGLLRRVRAAARRTLGDVSERGRRDRSLRRPPQPALHRRLRDARLGRRRRGRAAGDLAALGRTSEVAEVRDPRAYLVRIATRLALNRLRTPAAAARVVRRPVAARAAADVARRGRGRRARRQRLDGDAAGAGDARARPSGRCSCCARSSTCPTTRSRRPSTRAHGRGAADRAPGAHHVEARRPRQEVVTEQDGRRWSSASWPRSRPATCRVSWTCSRRTSSSSPTAAARSRRRCARSTA